VNVSVITTTEDFLGLRQDWERIQSENMDDNFYYSFDWYYALINFCKLPDCSLFIMYVSDQQKLIAILPCYIIKKRPRLFRFECIEFIGNIYSAYRGGIVLKGREDNVSSAVIDYLLSHQALWDVLYFDDISESDPFLSSLIHAMQKKAMVVRYIEHYANLVVDARSGQTAADYWKSRKKNLRQHIRRYINRMMREGKYKVVLTSRPGQDVQSAMKHYCEIYECSWKEPEFEPLFHGRLAEYLLNRNKLRLFTLYFKKCESTQAGNVASIPLLPCECDDTPSQCVSEGYLPIASAYCAINGSYACILKTAYHPDYAAYSAGTVLIWFVIQWLLDVDRAAVIDFQKDGDAYKYKWGKLKEMHMTMKAANPKKPVAVFETWSEKTFIPLMRKVGWLPEADFRVIEKSDHA